MISKRTEDLCSILVLREAKLALTDSERYFLTLGAWTLAEKEADQALWAFVCMTYDQDLD